MRNVRTELVGCTDACLPARSGLWLVLVGLATLGLTGCAALTNPTVESIPVHELPPNVLGKPQDPTVTIPLTWLEQTPTKIYRLGPNDVLGVYIEGVFGDAQQAPPVHLPESPEVTPSIGYPVPVREDGTVDLPLLPSLSVNGMTLKEATAAIRKAYLDAAILKPGRERISVTLLKKRTYRVTVMRQESGNVQAGSAAGVTLAIGATGQKLGTGISLELPAYQNDVLGVLARTGGLPGLDVYDEVIIMRNLNEEQREAIDAVVHTTPPGQPVQLPSRVTCPVIRIPLRAVPGTHPPFSPDDVILQTGDVVFVEQRVLDVFYTGGVLPPGEYTLPRDRDLDVVEAVALVKGLLFAGGVSSSNLSGSVIAPGIGSPSPSLLVVLRQLPSGGQVPIRVDLNKAARDPRERINVLAKDVLILQESPEEALVRYATEMIRFNFFFQLFKTSSANGSATIQAP